MFSRLLTVIACLIAAVRFACGATIELAGKQYPLGIKIEREIVPGDAIKLIKTHEYFDQFTGVGIFLFSWGGDIEEAMKIGRLIRRLPLTTFAPERSHNNEGPCVAR